MASPGDQNCANCIGTLSLPTPAHRGDVDRKQFSDIAITQTDGANTQFRVWCRDCERHTHGTARAFGVDCDIRSAIQAIVGSL